MMKIFCDVALEIQNISFSHDSISEIGYDRDEFTRILGKLFFMVITYHGLECFKVSLGDLTLAFNPFSKESAKKHGLKEVKFGADIVFVAAKHPDFSGVIRRKGAVCSVWSG